MAATVSIILPTYNRESLIKKAIDSVLDQTYDDWELIVADNASTDGTWQVICQYAERDSRIRCIRNPSNVGPFQNWVNAVALAQGQYLKFQWSDDWIEPTFLARSVREMQDPRVSFFYTPVHMHTGESVWTAYSIGARRRLVTRSSFIRGVFRYGRFPFSPGCALFRLDDVRRALELAPKIMGGIGYRANGAGPDLLVFLTAFGTSDRRAVYSPVPLSHFLDHKDSISQRRDFSLQYQLTLLRFLVHGGDKGLLRAFFRSQKPRFRRTR